MIIFKKALKYLVPVVTQHALATLLFENDGGTEAPLFKNPLKLADAIASFQGSPYQGKRGSVAALLYQCLNGQRRFPRPLKKAILEAAAQQLPSGDFASEIKRIDQIEECLDKPRVNKHERKPPIRKMDAVFGDFMAAAQISGNHFVVLSEFDELFHSPHSNVTFFIDLLTEKLNLTGKCIPATVQNRPDARYSFYFPSILAADVFWKMLFDKITKKNPLTNMSDEMATLRLRFLNNTSHLDIWVVEEPAICSFPLIVFNSDSIRPNGYSFYFNESGDPNFFKWSFERMAEFRNYFYTRRDIIKARRRLLDQIGIETAQNNKVPFSDAIESKIER